MRPFLTPEQTAPYPKTQKKAQKCRKYDWREGRPVTLYLGIDKTIADSQ